MGKQQISRLNGLIDAATQSLPKGENSQTSRDCERAKAILTAIHQTIETQATQEGIGSRFIPNTIAISRLCYPSHIDLLGPIAPLAAQQIMGEMDILPTYASFLRSYGAFKGTVGPLKGAANASHGVLHYLNNPKISCLTNYLNDDHNQSISTAGHAALIHSIATEGLLGWADYFTTTISEIAGDDNLSPAQKLELTGLLRQAEKIFYTLASKYYWNLTQHPVTLQWYEAHRNNALHDIDLVFDHTSNTVRADALTRIGNRLQELSNQSEPAHLTEQALLNDRKAWLQAVQSELTHSRTTAIITGLAAVIQIAQAKINDDADTPLMTIIEDRVANGMCDAYLDRIRATDDKDTLRNILQELVNEQREHKLVLNMVTQPPAADERKTHIPNLQARYTQIKQAIAKAQAIPVMTPVKELVDAFVENDQAKLGQYSRELWLSRLASLMFAALGTTIAAIGTEMALAGGIASATHAEFGATFGNVMADPGALAHGVQNLAANNPAVLASIILGSIIGVAIIGALCKLADDKLAGHYSENSAKIMKFVEAKVSEAKATHQASTAAVDLTHT